MQRKIFSDYSETKIGNMQIKDAYSENKFLVSRTITDGNNRQKIQKVYEKGKHAGNIIIENKGVDDEGFFKIEYKFTNPDGSVIEKEVIKFSHNNSSRIAEFYDRNNNYKGKTSVARIGDVSVVKVFDANNKIIGKPLYKPIIN